MDFNSILNPEPLSSTAASDVTPSTYVGGTTTGDEFSTTGGTGRSPEKPLPPLGMYSDFDYDTGTFTNYDEFGRFDSELAPSKTQNQKCATPGCPKQTRMTVEGGLCHTCSWNNKRKGNNPPQVARKCGMTKSNGELCQRKTFHGTCCKCSNTASKSRDKWVNNK
jgi:hypothetical protein